MDQEIETGGLSGSDNPALDIDRRSRMKNLPRVTT
jgi:hypothetical protein